LSVARAIAADHPDALFAPLAIRYHETGVSEAGYSDVLIAHVKPEIEFESLSALFETYHLELTWTGPDGPGGPDRFFKLTADSELDAVQTSNALFETGNFTYTTPNIYFLAR
jgi:hypothetical protein